MAARAAYIAGFAATSNVQARFEYWVPSSGTSAHAFTLVHDSERDAFAAQLTSLGSDTTLLVDTYEVEQAVRTAVEVAGPSLGAVRIDSGDLPALAVSVRALLDSLGATRPGSSSPGTSTSTRSPGSPRRRWTATASEPPWSPAPARRPRRWSTSWWPGRARRSRRRRWCRWPSAPAARPAWAGASGPPGGPTATGWPRRRWFAPGPPAERPGTPARPLVSRGEVVGREPLAVRERPAYRRPGRTARLRRPALRAATRRSRPSSAPTPKTRRTRARRRAAGGTQGRGESAGIRCAWPHGLVFHDPERLLVCWQRKVFAIMFDAGINGQNNCGTTQAVPSRRCCRGCSGSWGSCGQGRGGCRRGCRDWRGR